MGSVINGQRHQCAASHRVARALPHWWARLPSAPWANMPSPLSRGQWLCGGGRFLWSRGGPTIRQRHADGACSCMLLPWAAAWCVPLPRARHSHDQPQRYDHMAGTQGSFSGWSRGLWLLVGKCAIHIPAEGCGQLGPMIVDFVVGLTPAEVGVTWWRRP